jgi:hypothetical protein
MNGQRIEPDKSVCTYLDLTANLRSGTTEWSCHCNESTCANCMKDGWCPIYPKMVEKLIEITKQRIEP